VIEMQKLASPILLPARLCTCAQASQDKARSMTDYAAMTDQELIALEEYLYDKEVEGDDTWAERDQVLWEMNRRGLMQTSDITTAHPRIRTNGE
jgi:hypothetical protein